MSRTYKRGEEERVRFQINVPRPSHEIVRILLDYCRQSALYWDVNESRATSEGVSINKCYIATCVCTLWYNRLFSHDNALSRRTRVWNTKISSDIWRHFRRTKSVSFFYSFVEIDDGYHGTSAGATATENAAEEPSYGERYRVTEKRIDSTDRRIELFRGDLACDQWKSKNLEGFLSYACAFSFLSLDRSPYQL